MYKYIYARVYAYAYVCVYVYVYTGASECSALVDVMAHCHGACLDVVGAQDVVGHALDTQT